VCEALGDDVTAALERSAARDVMFILVGDAGEERTRARWPLSRAGCRATAWPPTGRAFRDTLGSTRLASRSPTLARPDGAF
jgi:hypothetical protein